MNRDSGQGRNWRGTYEYLVREVTIEPQVVYISSSGEPGR